MRKIIMSIQIKRITISAVPFIIIGLLAGCAASLLYEKMDYRDKKAYDEIQYIASKKERNNYLQIHKSQRKEFLKDFWRRRDPTPDTIVNEYKIEHYRRLAYANKYFGYALYPGWKTDRGWVYIKYGPPDKIDRNPAGSVDVISGGWQSPPYEVWQYDYASGLNMNTQMVFVDKFFTGDYKQVNSLANALADPWGRTESSGGISDDSNRTSDNKLSQNWGMSSQRSGTHYDFMQQRFKSMEHRKFIDEIEDNLKEKKPEVELSEMHLFVESNRFMAENGHLFVQFDYQIPYTDLKFIDMPDGNFRAALYIGSELQKGKESFMVGQVHKDITAEKIEETLDPFNCFTYSTGAIVSPGEYVLRVSVRDPTSGRIGYYSETLSINPFADDFDISSVELANEIKVIPPEANELFRKYNWRVLPNPEAIYPQDSNLAIYFEIYNLKL
ncbi:GWxTD domain-containing protein, partial [bacterium]|nr:GWxTD domain-containing protein [bacterium]